MDCKSQLVDWLLGLDDWLRKAIQRRSTLRGMGQEQQERTLPQPTQPSLSNGMHMGQGCMRGKEGGRGRALAGRWGEGVEEWTPSSCSLWPKWPDKNFPNKCRENFATEGGRQLFFTYLGIMHWKRGTIIISTATVLVCFGYVQRVDVGMYISLSIIVRETAVGYEDTTAVIARYSLHAGNHKGGRGGRGGGLGGEIYLRCELSEGAGGPFGRLTLFNNPTSQELLDCIHSKAHNFKRERE